MGEEETELVEGEGEGEPIDPRMAAVLEAAESGDLETLCSLFDQVEVSRCTLSSRSTVITPCFTKCDLAKSTSPRLAMRDQVNARGEDGDSPLHIACLYGQAAVVEECIKRGADVNARDEDDSTPLHDAAAGGFDAIVAQLLLKGASTSAKDNEEDTPLHHAARGGHAAVVEKLLAACSDRTAAQHG